ncbi:MAG: hypothetical protein H7831_11995 [Magnetococcus sp. WYHC-3]
MNRPQHRCAPYITLQMNAIDRAGLCLEGIGALSEALALLAADSPGLEQMEPRSLEALLWRIHAQAREAIDVLHPPTEASAHCA